MATKKKTPAKPATATQATKPCLTGKALLGALREALADGQAPAVFTALAAVHCEELAEMDARYGDPGPESFERPSLAKLLRIMRNRDAWDNYRIERGHLLRWLDTIERAIDRDRQGDVDAPPDLAIDDGAIDPAQERPPDASNAVDAPPEWHRLNECAREIIEAFAQHAPGTSLHKCRALKDAGHNPDTKSARQAFGRLVGPFLLQLGHRSGFRLTRLPTGFRSERAHAEWVDGDRINR